MQLSIFFVFTGKKFNELKAQAIKSSNQTWKSKLLDLENLHENWIAKEKNEETEDNIVLFNEDFKNKL